MDPYIHGMTWSEYVRRITGGDAQNVIAKKAGVDQSTVSRWLRGIGKIDPANAAALARAYHRPVIEAFVAADFIGPDEVDVQVTYTVVADPTDDELLELLRKRLARDQEEGGSDGDPAPKNPAGGSPANNVHTLIPPDPVASLDTAEWAARSGVPAQAPDTIAGEESQDPGDDDPV